MIILNSDVDTLFVVVGAVTTNSIPVVASYRESTSTTYAAKRAAKLLDGIVDSTIVTGVSGAYIGIDYISVYNTDTVANECAVYYAKDGVDIALWSGTLQPGEKVEYCKKGFVLKDVYGAEKTSLSIDYVQMRQTSGDYTTAILSSVANSTTSFADVTGLSFPVVANKLYWFRFVIRYQSAAAATGAAFAINGPTLDYLCFNGDTSNAAGTIVSTVNTSVYNTGTLATNSSNTPNCRAIMEGLIDTTADGTVIARFRSETAGSAITVNPGSFVEWEEIYSY